MRTPGGMKSIGYSLRVAREVGIGRLARAVNSKNACKTCALGMGGQRGGMRNEIGHFPEICKKSLQAQLTDIQDGIPAEEFNTLTLARLRELRPRELERLGRLNTPLYKASGADRFEARSWEDMLRLTAARLRSCEPDRSFFYASGRSSNEAAFLLHLFVRLYGTNNVNNCSYYCHQASGVGLASTIGSGTATVQLEDVQHADLIFVIGANPSSNHPRFVSDLLRCRQRGGHVVVINPALEPGMLRFNVPSSLRSMLAGGSEIASHYLQPNIGSDTAVLKGIAKTVLARGKADANFVRHHTHGYEAFEQELNNVTWEEITSASGLAREEIEQVGDVYANARNVIFTWAMGITHHEHGVGNVEMIVNLALLRGMIGRPHAGLLPLRGHSNVQGVGSVGVTPQLKQAIFDAIERELKVKLPQTPGMDTMACMDAAAEGRVDVAFMLGGNLFGSNPDRDYADGALNNVPFKVFLNTTLNEGHVYGVDGEVVILPVAARDEEPQRTTQESMFNFVRLSDGGIVRLDNVRSEVDIICDLATQVLGANAPLDFAAFKNYDTVRDAIARTVPGFGKIGEINATGQEFQIDGRTFHVPKFNTPDGRAAFKVVPIPVEVDLASNELRMMTVRSEGQFNTIVYEEDDAWRGQRERWIIMMNKADIARMGLRDNDLVDLRSSAGEMHNVRVRPFNMSAGNAMMYFPEANVLVPTALDKRSRTPAFKNIRISVHAAAGRVQSSV